MFGMGEEFWEDGRVILFISAIISIINVIIVWIITKGYKEKKWFLRVPIMLFGIIGIIGFIMVLFPNGTFGVTQHFYLGIFAYAMSITIITRICESLILLIEKYVDKNK